MKYKSKVVFLIKLAVTIFFLWFLFSVKGVSIKKSFHILKNSNYLYFILALLLLFFGQFICSYRWKVILDSMEVNIPHMKLFQFYLIGMFFSLFLPSIVGGDFVKIFYVREESKKSLSYAITSIYLERACGFLFLILFGILGALLFRMDITNRELPILSSLGIKSINIVFIPLFFLIVFIIANVFVFSSFLYKIVIKILNRFKLDKISEKVSIIHETTKIFLRKPSLLSIPLLISAINIFFVYIENYLIGIGIGIKAPFLAYMIIISVMSTVVMLPISINGIGLRENIFVLLFALIGVDPNKSFSLSLISFLVVVFSAIPGWFVFSYLKTKTFPSEIKSD